jgi:dihydrodipicolinate synthase/N-acetylneuraminate lyase
MASLELPRLLRGIVPPLVTPLAGPDELDSAGLERLVEHVLAGGVHGLFVLGTTGEGPALSGRLKRELIGRVCRQVAGCVPVLVGITDPSVAEAIALARSAADAGAHAVVAAAPYYFALSQAELGRFVRTLAAATPLPLFLYNMPSHAKAAFGLDVVRAALDIDNVVGLKDSSGDLDYFRAVRRLAATRQEWTLLVGPEHLTAETVRLGGDGGVNGGANVHPRLFVELYEAAQRGATEQVSRLQRQVEFFGRIYQLGRSEAAVIQGLKCALNCLGICSDRLAEPFAPLASAEREQVRGILGELNLLAAGCSADHLAKSAQPP